MRGYNLYYKQNKINNSILSKGEVENILSKQVIHKKINNSIFDIPVRDIKYYEVVVI